MNSTPQVFAEKWNRWSELLFDENSGEKSGILNWILSRNGWSSLSELGKFLEGRNSILDAGCGNGRVTRILAETAPSQAEIVGWDINPIVASRNLANYDNVVVELVDLSRDELPQRKFDFIYCQEVLHHLPDPRGTLLRLSELLSPGGVIAIYVYGLKGAIREFSDEHVREVFGRLDEKSRADLIEGITRLGQQLCAINGEVTITGLEPIGFRDGTFSVQKFFYDSLFKCFWNDQLGLEASKAINFDWYAPSLASKHTLPEVLGWMNEAGLEISHAAQDEYGVTAHGTKS